MSKKEWNFFFFKLVYQAYIRAKNRQTIDKWLDR